MGKMVPVDDGTRRGFLSVLRHVGAPRGRGGRIECRCDCGRTVELSCAQFRKRISCSHACPFGRESAKWGQPAPLPMEQWAPRRTARKIRDRIKAGVRRRERKLEFSLTVDDIVRIRVGAPCSYCGDEIRGLCGGLDRIDNDRGYTVDNVVACCPMCNDARGHLLTHEEFKAAIAVRLASTGPGRAWNGYGWRTALKQDKAAA